MRSCLAGRAARFERVCARLNRALLAGVASVALTAAPGGLVVAPAVASTCDDSTGCSGSYSSTQTINTTFTDSVTHAVPVSGATNNLTVNNGQTGTLTLSGNNTFGSTFGKLTVDGGTLILTGTNSFDGAATVASGATLSVNNETNIASATGIALNGGTLQVGNTNGGTTTLFLDYDGAFASRVTENGLSGGIDWQF